MVIKNDPGAPIIWTAFGALIVGLMLSFYFPRRRVWARLSSQGGVQLAMLTDRYVNAEREFAGLLEDLSTHSGRRPERANVLEASA
jgi:cytochrome c biogenesis protein